MTTGRVRQQVELTARDLEILRGLFDVRVASLEHLAALHFEGRYEAAAKRLWKLKAAGFVRERPRRVAEASILSLTRSGLRVLEERGELANVPKLSLAALTRRAEVAESTLRHELAIVGLKAALVAAARRSPGVRVQEFITWPKRIEFRARPLRGSEVLVKPDGFLRLREGDAESLCFLELDRSTETQAILAERVLCYLDFYNRGGLAERLGAPRSDYRRYPFRVLLVVPSAERRNNLAETLLRCRPPVQTFAWLTTLAEAFRDPLDAIWVRPSDYAMATAGGAFDITRPAAHRYASRPAREALVESRVQKHRLLG